MCFSVSTQYDGIIAEQAAEDEPSKILRISYKICDLFEQYKGQLHVADLVNRMPGCAQIGYYGFIPLLAHVPRILQP